VLTLGVTVLITSTTGIGCKMRDLHRKARLPVPAKALREIMFTYPNQKREGSYSGPVDEHGFFPLSFGFVFPDLQTFRPLDCPNRKPCPNQIALCGSSRRGRITS